MVLSSVDSPVRSQARRAIVSMTACLPASCWPLRALAQAPSKAKKQVVSAYLSTPLAELAGPEPAYPGARAVVHALRDLGWVDGGNVAIRFMSAEGQSERLPSLVAQAVKSAPDVIVANGAAADVAKNATDTIPIVAVVQDAASVVSPLQPGRNVTVVTTDAGLNPKRLELLKAIAPQIAKIAVLTEKLPAGWEGSEPVVEIEAAARTLGLTLVILQVAGPDDLVVKLMQAVEQKVDAIGVDNTVVNFARRRTIAEFALQRRLPTASNFSQFVEAGGLMAYGPNSEDLGRRIAAYVDKILKGAKPADLPVNRPTVFDLTVNTTTAKALGLVIPSDLQLLITRTIE
jgi:putative ABC transport system substrate-binding protein